MKIDASPGITVVINIGAPEVAAATKKPNIPPDVIKQRLANLHKGRMKKQFNRDIYPKKVTKDGPETPGLDPQPRKGYYH